MDGHSDPDEITHELYLPSDLDGATWADVEALITAEDWLGAPRLQGRRTWSAVSDSAVTRYVCAVRNGRVPVYVDGRV